MEKDTATQPLNKFAFTFAKVTIIEKDYVMKKIARLFLIFCALFSVGAYAGNGSGNPKNDLGYGAKYDQKPHYIWKDGKLVKNPDNTTSKKQEVAKSK